MKKIKFPFPISRNDELRGGAGWDRIEKSLQEIAGFINSGNDAITAAIEAAEAAQDAAENAATQAGDYADEAFSGTPEGYESLVVDVGNLKSLVESPLLFDYGEPSGIDYALGSFTSSGGFASYKNTVRTNNAVKAYAGSVISCSDGYIMRIYIYNSAAEPPASYFVQRSNWVTSYKVESDCYVRVQIGDTTHYTDNTYVLPNTNYKNNIVWTYFIKNTIRQAVTTLQDTVNTLANGLDVLSAFSNIFCCGDSLTASVVYTGETTEGGETTYTTRAAYKKWPDILGHKIDATPTYKAIGGYSAKDWWTAFSSYIAEADNQLAIIYLATNGGLTDTVDTDAPGDDVANYSKTTNTGCYCSIVKSFLDVGAKVLLLHVAKSSSNANTVNSVIDKIGDKFNVPYVTVPFLTDAKYHYYPDKSGQNTLHYNDLGYAAFTDLLIQAVGNLSTDLMARMIPT